MMKKIITSLANPVLNEKLKKLYKYEILIKDIQYQEGVIEFLKENSNVDVLILSEILPGALEKREFINSICSLVKNIKIIVITEKEDVEFENFLISRGINNIFCDSKVEFEQIVNAIDCECISKGYKNVPKEILEELNYLKEVIENNKKKNLKLKIKNKFNKKGNLRNQLIKSRSKKDNNVFNFSGQIISVTGIAGCGKSVFLSTLASIIQKRNNLKILIIDADDINNSIHELFGIKKYPQRINKVIRNESEIIRRISLEDLIISYKNTGISVISLDYSIPTKQILQEIGVMKEKYDLILIDMPNEIEHNIPKELLRISSKTIFMTEPNLLGISKLNKIISSDGFINNYELKETSYICFNKYSKQSIDKNVIKDIFSQYKFLATINFDDNLEKFINKGNIYYRELSSKSKKEYQEISEKLFLLYKKNSFVLNCRKKLSFNSN